MRADLAKERLRKQFLETRRALTFEAVWRKSAIIEKNLVETAMFKNASRIALYSSIENEVLTDGIFTSGSLEKKKFFYPSIFIGALAMRFLLVTDLKELTPGAYEIREPDKAKEGVNPGELDLIVMPGVAFSPKGARLGFGKGYYDRVLEGLKCPLAALAYEFQILDSIPTESFDVSMDYIITEKRVIRCCEEQSPE